MLSRMNPAGRAVRIMRTGHGGVLFVCHANCCRSVLACYLYRHLCNKAPALSAGLEVGERIKFWRLYRRLRGVIDPWEPSGTIRFTLSPLACLSATKVWFQKRAV